MFLLSHLGITLAGAVVASQITSVLSRPDFAAPRLRSGIVSSDVAGAGRTVSPDPPIAFPHPRRALLHQLDYRLIAVGSVLPDVDKLIGLEVFGRFDRSIFHTLLWFLLLAAASVLLYRRTRDTRGLQLAGCWAMHLVLDAMWTDPRLLLWPFLGPMPSGGEFGFPEFTIYAEHALLTDWHQYVPELIGLTVVATIAIVLARRGLLWAFLRTGRFTLTDARPGCS